MMRSEDIQKRGSAGAWRRRRHALTSASRRRGLLVPRSARLMPARPARCYSGVAPVSQPRQLARNADQIVLPQRQRGQLQFAVDHPLARVQPLIECWRACSVSWRAEVNSPRASATRAWRLWLTLPKGVMLGQQVRWPASGGQPERQQRGGGQMEPTGLILSAMDVSGVGRDGRAQLFQRPVLAQPSRVSLLCWISAAVANQAGQLRGAGLHGVVQALAGRLGGLGGGVQLAHHRG